MDLAIFWLPIFGSILLGGLAGSAWYGGNKSLGLWLAFAGVICLALVVVLQIQQAIWKSQASAPSASTVTPTQTNLLDNSIGFECAWSAPPSHYRDDKTLFIVDFQGVPVTGINPAQQVAGPMSFRRSGEPFKASDHYSDIWYRCGVTNFGTQPVRNLRAKFPVQFAEAEPTQNGAQSGTILANGYALTPSIDLGTGSGGSDYFYFANASPAFIEVSVPTTAILQTLTDDEWHVVKLIPPSPGKAAFSLIPSTNPLNVRHPAPAAAPTPPETKDGSSAISEQSGRRYTKTDAERMLSALFELYDTLNSNVDAVGRIEGFWLSPSQQMQGKTTKEKVAIAAQTREHVRNISKDIYNTIMPKYQYYAEDLRPLIQGDGVIGQANGVLNEFIEAADVLPADANEQLIKLALESKQAKLDSVMSDFVRWAGDSKTRISSKRSEIESHEK